MSLNGLCTVGIVMIGDEILKGQIIDTNSNFLTKRLHALGVKVCKMVVVSDDVEEIAEEVKRFSQKYDFVITSGGIGPTHDDVTYSGIAEAFGEIVILNSEMAHVLQRFYPGKSCTNIQANPALKLAMIPTSGKLVYVETMEDSLARGLVSNNSFPIVQVNNVYILPGIPEYFEYNFIHLEKFLKNAAANCVFHTRQIYLLLNEVEIVSTLNCAVEKFKTTVIFGSYPSLSSKLYKTRLIIESTSKDDVEDAVEFLRNRFPPECIVDCGSTVSAVDSIKSAQLMSHGKYLAAIKAAVNVLEECCNKYSPSQIFISFNGGKDCTVLLHLASTVFKKKFPNSEAKINAVYIRSHDPFPELEAFIDETTKRFDLDITTVPGPIKIGLEIVLKDKPEFKAVLMGTRRSDPYSETLQKFQMTDNGWPQVMRVSPLLDWEYDDIWKYLQDHNVPYCSLYDKGYTSLGSRYNTKPNPALSYTAANGETNYHPAHSLKDVTAERDGRQ